MTGEPTGGLTLSYNYHLNGSIKSITDPFGNVVNYGSDKVGRMTTIGNGTSPTAYVSGNASETGTGIKYRAFGGLKSMSFNTTQATNVTMTYDNALRPITYEANSAANATAIQKASYVYNPDGLLKEITHDAVDDDYDQANEYDFAGRLRSNSMGDGDVNPYTQTLENDAFGNLTYRDTHTYNLSGRAFTATYTNNRTDSAHTRHDAAGNVVKTESGNVNARHDLFSEFDAAGRQWRWEEYGPHGDATKKAEETVFDGDGRPAKRSKLTKGYFGSPPSGYWGSWGDPIEYFYFYSSVTGQKISEIDSEANSIKGYVYMGETVIADSYRRVTDPVSGSTRQVNGSGVPVAYDPMDEESSHVEMAGLGTAVPPVEPDQMPPPDYDNGGYVGNAKDGCEFDGMPMPCNIAALWAQYDDDLPKPGIKPSKDPRYKPGVIPAPNDQESDSRRYGSESKHAGWRFQEFSDGDVFADNVDRKQNRKGLMKMRFGSGDGAGYGWMGEPGSRSNFGFECRSLADVIGSQAFRDASQRAWDRSKSPGLPKHEEGSNLFIRRHDATVMHSDRVRRTQSIMMPWMPDQARKVGDANNAIWMADIHTHPWRDKEMIPGVGTALTPWLPSDDDLDISRTSGIAHITLFPNMNSYDFYVIKDGAVFEKKDWGTFSVCFTTDE